MVVAVIGCVFGIFGIFTVGPVFVPLAGLCALFGVISGAIDGRPSAVFLSIIAGILAAFGWVESPALWLTTAAMLAPH
jgi:hypothetical protein